ncbi:MAG: cysteine-rich repeat protein [Bradymonadia bacterium]|jgi:cysteine-rich repeat protein
MNYRQRISFLISTTLSVALAACSGDAPGVEFPPTEVGQDIGGGDTGFDVPDPDAGENVTADAIEDALPDVSEEPSEGSTRDSPDATGERVDRMNAAPGERDDSNNLIRDGGASDCTSKAFEACGDGVLDEGEQCDDGNAIETDGCTTECTAPACGDGAA